jgi:plastocyanin
VDVLEDVLHRRETLSATRMIALVLVGAALTVGLPACGGNDDEASNETTAAAATTTEASSAESGNTLEGETGPGFTIEVKQNGSDAESVAAGTYTLKVEDKSAMHNFHLIGPGVDEEVTDVPFEGEKTVEVTLQAGEYTYQCDPHASRGMKGTFTVTG